MRRLWPLFVVVFGSGWGCNSSNDDPAAYVTGLRILGIKAEPPEVPPGSQSTLTALIVDTDGNPFHITWEQCLDPALSGQSVNRACVGDAGTDLVAPIGDGVSVVTTMPTVTPANLGRVDATGGFYLPIVANITGPSDAITAVYLLRLGLGLPPNRNPTLTDLLLVTGGGPDGGVESDTPLVDGTPLVVHAGEAIVLRPIFSADSVESYPIYDGDPRTTTPRPAKETLSVAWFATAGTLLPATSSGVDAPVADEVFHLDQQRNGPTIHVPPVGTVIDLWVVARDERGGTDWLHRTLQLE